MKYILIIAGGLQVGGAEKVAANICLYEKKREFEFHYIIFEGNQNVYGPEIEKCGGKVFEIPSPSKNYISYIKTLRMLIKKYNYSVVHSHTMFNSGINLLVAKLCGVPCRIAHSHTTKTETEVSWKQKIYEKVMRKIITHTTTDYVACGIEAGNWLFGEKIFQKKGIVIKNGIDIDKYIFSEFHRKNIREKLYLSDKFVIGHSGTLIPLKNQKFLIEIMPEIVKIKPNAVLLLMGDGDEQNVKYLQEKIIKQGVQGKVILCGCLNNVHEYLNAIDVFAFPSKREGTPLALIEAQINGLPCIISDTIPKDAILTELVKKISLVDEKNWIESISYAKRNKEVRYDQNIRKMGYDVNNSMEIIYSIYRGE